MLRVLACLALIACGSKDPAPSSPTLPPSPSTTTESTAASTASAPSEPLPPVTKVGDTCKVSKDCNPLGAHHRCMRTGTGAGCYESPMKVCDEPSCDCFNNDPCAANELGTCSGYEKGVVICKQ